VRLDALLGHRLGDALGGAPLELARQQVAQPALEQRHLMRVGVGVGVRARVRVKVRVRVRVSVRVRVRVRVRVISGTTPRKKKSHTRQPGAQKPQPGPLPTGPVLKR